MEKLLAEHKALKLGVAPVSVAAVAVNGERISMKEMRRVAVVVAFEAAASDLSVSFQQHDAASGGTSKALVISNHYYVKKGAETKFTKSEVSVAASSYAINPGNVIGLAVFEILEEDLDVNGDFSHISVDLTGTATARICSAIYVGSAEKLPAYLLDL